MGLNLLLGGNLSKATWNRIMNELREMKQKAERTRDWDLWGRLDHAEALLLRLGTELSLGI
jgi:hypothetical protein